MGFGQMLQIIPAQIVLVLVLLVMVGLFQIVQNVQTGVIYLEENVWLVLGAKLALLLIVIV